jgi:hypothetical protein
MARCTWSCTINILREILRYKIESVGEDAFTAGEQSKNQDERENDFLSLSLFRFSFWTPNFWTTACPERLEIERTYEQRTFVQN